ncbi:hypothetical protein V2J09_012000 [Rumex salicifolius]
MQPPDPPPNPSSANENTPILDQPAMNGVASSPIDAKKTDSEVTAVRNADGAESAKVNGEAGIEVESKENGKIQNEKSSSRSVKNGASDVVVERRERPTRACTVRSKLYVEPPLIHLRSRPAKKEKKAAAVVAAEDAEGEEEEEDDGGKGQCGKIITPLLNEPPLGQIPRRNLRAMWEMASILNFFNVFRPLLNITVEFSAEELETSLITPNDTLSYIHIPLLKAIPPVIRMACGRETWVTVLCRKLRDWWHWVAEGELPIVAAHGAEVEAYKTLDPAVRVVILKALCDIRVEKLTRGFVSDNAQQEDIRSYIDDSMKQGIQLVTFRKERIGGDSHGISYWYEDDAIIGHRLYREIRKVEMKKAKIKGSNVLPCTTYEWETVATNLDEFQDVSEKLFSSLNRTEVSLGKKLKNDFLVEIEKVHKRKEKLLKKQQREALLLDSYANMDGLVAGRSLRDRKPVTYTFGKRGLAKDDFDRSINEAIKITKQKQPSPEPGVKREANERSEPNINGTWSEPSHPPDNVFFSPPSPPEYEEMDEVDKSEEDLDRSNRRRRKPQRYSEKDFVDEASDNDRDYDTDDDIVGEAVYDDEYIRKKKRSKLSSSSEGDEEYHWSDENGEEEDEEEESDHDSLSMSEDSDRPQRLKKPIGRTRRETKSRFVNELQSGLRRSKRSTRNRINYQQYEMSESDHDSAKQGKLNASENHSDGSDNDEFTMESPGSNALDEEDNMGFDQPHVEEEHQNNHQGHSVEPTSVNQDSGQVGKAHFLDLNEAAPGSGFDDGPSALIKDSVEILDQKKRDEEKFSGIDEMLSNWECAIKK